MLLLIDCLSYCKFLESATKFWKSLPELVHRSSVKLKFESPSEPKPHLVAYLLSPYNPNLTPKAGPTHSCAQNSLEETGRFLNVRREYYTKLQM